jgi:endonuclease/exonuclease/phosphatase family metal-dependent hydrolase
MVFSIHARLAVDVKNGAETQRYSPLLGFGRAGKGDTNACHERYQTMKNQESYETKKNVARRVMFNALRMKTKAILLIAATLVLSWSATAGQPCGYGGRRGVETMTVNLYIGGGINRIVALDPTAPDYLTKLVTTVTGVYYEIVASQPSVRIGGVADAIAARLPDIVAVEEATLLRNQSPGDLVVGGTSPATNVVFDYVQILVDALETRGAHYAVVSTADEWDAEMPMLNLQTGSIDDIRQTDREAILVRTDLPRGQLHVLHPQSGNFTNVITFPAIGLSLTRGWCSVDVCLRGETFRYICAHLEEETAPQLQILQAQELFAGPAKTRLPVLLCGDFNADPLHRDGSLAYDTITAQGFYDAWTGVHRNNPAGGLTWGHDEFLADLTTLFDRRIDLVFYKGCSFVPIQSEVVDVSLGRSEAPLWASDHAAVFAAFRLR